MCSYGGKIHPRPHDNQLTYVGGDTKIFSVDRNTKFSSFISKLSSLCDSSEVCFKYQLPGEDLDALISVTNDEDLEHMMLEYDRIHRSAAKPARLRLFIFPLNNSAAAGSFGSNDSKSETQQWFVDALNSVQLNQTLDDSSTPSAAAETEAKKDSDFLFGFDKGHPQPARLQDQLSPVAPTVMVGKEFSGRAEERHVIGEPVAPPPEFQRQIQEFQRMQISNHEQLQLQGAFNRKFEDYYQEKAPPPPQPHPAAPMANPPTYWKERHDQPYPAGTNEPQVYLIQTPTGVYHAPAPAMRQVTGQVGHQPYYGVQRMVPEVYREQQQQQHQQQQQMYNAVVPPPAASSTILQQQQQQQPQPKISGAYTSDGIGLVRSAATTEPGGGGYGQVGYDGAGRQVYYAAAGPGGLMQPPPPYTAVHPMAGGMDVRQTGGALNQEGKIIGKPSQPS